MSINSENMLVGVERGAWSVEPVPARGSFGSRQSLQGDYGLPQTLRSLLPALCSLLLLLLSTTSAAGGDLTIYLSRTVPADKSARIVSFVRDLEVVTDYRVQVRARPLLGSGRDAWLVLDEDSLADYHREDGFVEPVENLLLSWLQDTTGIIWPAPEDVARLDVPVKIIPFREWRQQWELNPPRSYISRRFSRSRTDVSEREWQLLNRDVEHFSFNHNPFRYITPDLFDDYPHLFAKDEDGQPMRPRDLGRAGFTDHPDLREPEVVERMARAAVEYFEKNPQARSFSISGNDSFVFGHYPEDDPFVDTNRYFRRYIDYSNHVFHFSNQVAEKVGKTYPDKYLGALAYMSWENVPDFPVHPKIVPYMTADRTQWYDKEFREEDLNLVEEWANAGTEILGTWNYFYGHAFLFPRSLTKYAAESIKEMYERGMRAYYSEVGIFWAYDAHRTWLMKQLLWDVDRDPEELLNQFFQAYYGPAAEPMRKFFDHAENIWMNQPGKAYWLRYYIDAHQAYLFSEVDLRVMRGLLEEAVRQSSRRADSPTNQQPNNPTTPQTPHLRRIQFTSDAFALTEVFIEYMHLKWAISRGEHGLVVRSDREEPGFLFEGMDFVSPEGIDEAIARLDELERQFLDLRKSLTKNPLHRHLANTDWALEGDPRQRAALKAESGEAVGGEAVDSEAVGGEAVGGEAVGSGQETATSGQEPATSTKDHNSTAQQLDKSTSATSQVPRTLVPDWSLWHNHWRSHIMDTEGALVSWAGDRVRAVNIRRGQLFRAMPAEEGVVYQAKVKFQGQNGPSSKVFVRLDWYDAAGKQISSSTIDRLPPGVYPTPITIGPVAQAPKGTKFVRLFIRFYEMEIGDMLWLVD